jgi:nucleotide-binding universal stress UspA family protein
MYRILMPVDSSESRGTAQAEAVVAMPAAAESIEVTLLYVFDENVSMSEASLADPEGGQRDEDTSPEQIVGGRAAATRLKDAGVAVEQLSRYGAPAAEILAAAEQSDADCIVLGGRKRSPGQSLVFGSVSQAVLLESDRPVTITGGEK